MPLSSQGYATTKNSLKKERKKDMSKITLQCDNKIRPTENPQNPNHVKERDGNE